MIIDIVQKISKKKKSHPMFMKWINVNDEFKKRWQAAIREGTGGDGKEVVERMEKAGHSL